jgi:putative chitinase
MRYNPNRKSFYNDIRPLFGGRINQKQVEGMEAILDEWEEKDYKDLRWLSYILATAFHETAKTMQPVREYGRGQGHKYGEVHPKTGQVYYGRGHVQLTWDYNYLRMGKRLGIDLYYNPDLALDMTISVKILFDGMINGMFTGKSLSQYFNEDVTDWVNARKIVNGLDKAQTIATYALKFHYALLP